MRKLLILLAILTLSACSGGGKGGGGGGGGGGSSPLPPATPTCQDANATNIGGSLPCVCKSGFMLSSGICVVDDGSGGSGSIPPDNFFYSPALRTVVVNTLLANGAYIPSIANCGAGCTYAIVGGIPLPTGMNINPANGAIYGTPTTVGNRNGITVRATKSGGLFADTTFSLRVVYPAPSNLQLSDLTDIYKVGLSIPPKIVSHGSGEGAVTSMTIDPPLPNGLNFGIYNASFGFYAITGTPSESSAATEYTITACGTTDPCATIKTTFATVAAPSFYTLDISGEPGCQMDGGIPACEFNQFQTFNPIIGLADGDDVVFSIISGGEGAIPSNELPSGISLTSSGGIATTSFGSFEPTSCTAGGNGFCLYTLRVQNSMGSVQTQFKLKINAPGAPTGFHYTGSPFLFRVLTPISELVPEFDSSQNPNCIGSSGCFTVTPALPSGLNISPLSGKILGSADQISVQAPTLYTISANDSRGTLTTQISIEIKERLPVFVYNNNQSYVFSKGINISASGAPSVLQNAPTCTGGGGGGNYIPITSFSISPALPPGLTLNTAGITCGAAPETTGGAISGIPTALAPYKEYTVTACNSGGCTNTILNLEVAAQVDKVVTGADHACAIVHEEPSSPGKVMCWGANDRKQLGFVSSDTCGAIDCSKKGKYVKLGSNDLDNIIDISAGRNHTCALRDPDLGSSAPGEGEVFCWGANESGQLGNGSTIDSLTPVRMIRSDDHVFSGASKIAAGGNASCIGAEKFVPEWEEPFTFYDQVYCVGENYGNKAVQINNFETVPSTGENYNIFAAITLKMGEDHSCAIYAPLDEDDNPNIDASPRGIKCWGLNDKGQLGNNATSSSFSTNPVKVLVGPSLALEGNVDLSLGGNHSCAIQSPTLGSARKLFCWGDNSVGQLGIGSAGSFSSLALQSVSFSGSGQMLNVVSLGSMKNALQAYYEEPVTLNPLLAFAGQYALAAPPYVGTQSAIPIKIQKDYGGIIDNLYISGRPGEGSSSEDFTCAIERYRGPVCWGKNDAGQLGNGGTNDAGLPKKVVLDY